MRCSLFGKLSAKRDFIALSVPRDFLNAWEPWMQACVSASRDGLGDFWLQAYLTAPIWRFWLGADICGATVVGALIAILQAATQIQEQTLTFVPRLIGVGLAMLFCLGWVAIIR